MTISVEVSGERSTMLSHVPPSAIAAVVNAARGAADSVDREARFPVEAVEAMRAGGLLSCSLPEQFGGRGTGVRQLAAIAREIGAVCSSAAMVFAMHHIQALCLTRHATTGPVSEITMRIAADEALLASATTEISTGGDVRSSTCAVVSDGEQIVLEKNAPVISYGEHADYIFATARRTCNSPPSDQVLVICPSAHTTLEKTGTWDVLGFRGTCSPGYLLRATTTQNAVIATDYATISASTMLPTSHLLWASVWLGMADAALAKAQSCTRAAARKAAGGAASPQAAKFADLIAMHQNFESAVFREIDRYDDFIHSGGTEPTISFAIAMNNLKIISSTAVLDVVTAALQLVGISGYRNDHDLSMGRLLRDSFGPQLMVSNDRIRANNAQLAPAYRRMG